MSPPPCTRARVWALSPPGGTAGEEGCADVFTYSLSWAGGPWGGLCTLRLRQGPGLREQDGRARVRGVGGGQRPGAEARLF